MELEFFFVGLIRNVLILKTRKIVYSWALHLSFTLVYITGFYVNIDISYIAREPERFNVVFGNIPMVILTGFLAIKALIWLNYNRLNKNYQ